MQVLAHSIYRRASKPVSITPLVIEQLPITRRSLTTFTFSRYLAPWLCGFEGQSIFFDADMLCLGDVYELADLADKDCAVSVVKNKQRFEWPSMMVFNNAKCRALTPEFIDDPESVPQAFRWAESVGDLPPDWNHCVGYDPEPDETPKLVHYTAGLPCWPETKGCPYSDEWWDEYRHTNSSVSWADLMAKSVHAELVTSGRIKATAKSLVMESER